LTTQHSRSIGCDEVGEGEWWILGQIRVDAASGGQLEVLKWARENGWVWDEEVHQNGSKEGS